MKYEKISGRIIGTKQYVDCETGEVIEAVNMVKTIDSDRGFHKVWLYDLMDIITEIGSKKIQVVEYLLKNLNSSNNSISITIREIAQELNISSKTANETILALIKANFLRRVRNGFYLVNPNVLIQGTNAKRQRVMVEYKEASIQLSLFDEPSKQNKIA